MMLAVSVATAVPCPAGDPPAIVRLVPPGGQIGTAVEVTLEGKPGSEPLQAWSEQGELAIDWNQQPDKATIKIPADAQPGIHWLRIYNPFGATELLPFFVGTLPEIAEIEPNNQLAQAQPIVPSTVNGVLHKSGEVDMFAIAVEGDQTVTATVQANRELGSPMDAVLELLDPNGTVIASNDDDLGNDPRIEMTIPSGGLYHLRIFAFPAAPDSTIRLAGSSNYAYRLTVAIDGLPESDSTFAESPAPEAVEFTVPWSASGVIGQPAETDQFAFAGSSGQSLTIAIAARQHFSRLDPLAVLKTESGTVVKEFDDISGTDPDVSFETTLPADGRYVLEVKDRFGHGGQRYTYHATVSASSPSYSAKMAANAVVLTADKALEIPITIDRQHGFNERILVIAAGLPSGVTAEPVISEPEGDSSKQVVLKIARQATAAASSGPIQIVSKDESNQAIVPIISPRPNSKQPVNQIWLTVSP
jgi:hypothetical protein